MQIDFINTEAECADHSDMMRRLIGFLLLAAPSVPTQPFPAKTSAAQALQFEVTLRNNPNDRAARIPTLNPTKAINARRNHILWLIENTPSDPIAGKSAATIDAAGHRLADAEGFKVAAEADRQERGGGDHLGECRSFFKLGDPEFGRALLERAWH